MGALMLLIVLYDVITGSLGLEVAVLSLFAGALVGWFTSRIFHLSWDRDGKHVVGRIDGIGWTVLALYIVFEVARNALFTNVIHTGYDPTAITFAFISAALLSRVLGLRGRIVRILEEERIFS